MIDCSWIEKRHHRDPDRLRARSVRRPLLQRKRRGPNARRQNSARKLGPRQFRRSKREEVRMARGRTRVPRGRGKGPAKKTASQEGNASGLCELTGRHLLIRHIPRNMLRRRSKLLRPGYQPGGFNQPQTPHLSRSETQLADSLLPVTFPKKLRRSVYVSMGPSNESAMSCKHHGSPKQPLFVGCRVCSRRQDRSIA